jgi:hypothetical protein
METKMSDISNRLNTIIANLSSEENLSDANKIDTKKNRSAGTRVRKQLKVAMDELKALRGEVLAAFKED